jgi:hypothetical protein
MGASKGVLMCIARIILGDFDFVERYRGDNFKTIFPKRLDEIDKIISVLPDISGDIRIRFCDLNSGRENWAISSAIDDISTEFTDKLTGDKCCKRKKQTNCSKGGS